MYCVACSSWLQGVFAKNERGYILLLSVASIRRKLLKTTHTEERTVYMNFMTQQIRLVAIKSPYFSPEAYTPLHFSRTLPLNVDPVLEINRSLQWKEWRKYPCFIWNEINSFNFFSCFCCIYLEVFEGIKTKIILVFVSVKVFLIFNRCGHLKLCLHSIQSNFLKKKWWTPDVQCAMWITCFS